MSSISRFTLSALFLALGLPAASVMLSAEAQAGCAVTGAASGSCHPWTQKNGKWVPTVGGHPKTGGNRKVSVELGMKKIPNGKWKIVGKKCLVNNFLVLVSDSPDGSKLRRCPGITSDQSRNLDMADNADFIADPLPIAIPRKSMGSLRAYSNTGACGSIMLGEALGINTTEVCFASGIIFKNGTILYVRSRP